MAWVHEFSSPFSGTFFQYGGKLKFDGIAPFMSSSPFSGTFFNRATEAVQRSARCMVFVPFLGDLFSIRVSFASMTAYRYSFRPLSWELSFNKAEIGIVVDTRFRFRPLSWGLSFNIGSLSGMAMCAAFSSPFLGTFFQCPHICTGMCSGHLQVFVPFLGDFLSIVKIER